jgi:phospholipid/cholesterol/gamma-HCH transport system substrate-binding protein
MIDADFRIPVNSVAKIVSSDIMGTRSIKMIMSDEQELYQPNDTIPGAVESDLKEQVSMQVLPIKNKAEQLLGTIDSAITVLTVIFNEDAQRNLSESFAKINRTIANIEQTTSDLQEIISSEKQSVRRIVTNIDSVTSAFKQNSKNFETVMNNLVAFSDTLSQFSVSPVLQNISDASNQILVLVEKLNSDESTAGLLLNDDELYNSINGFSENLSSLVNDIQNNPKRYLQFSAIDLGKDVYINTGNTAVSKNIVFKVHLVSTENKIDTNSHLFEGLENVEEYHASGVYSYLYGETNSYAEIIELQNKAKELFSDASIVAFKNGRLIKLERALKSLRE